VRGDKVKGGSSGTLQGGKSGQGELEIVFRPKHRPFQWLPVPQHFYHTSPASQFWVIFDYTLNSTKFCTPPNISSKQNIAFHLRSNLYTKLQFRGFYQYYVVYGERRHRRTCYEIFLVCMLGFTSTSVMDCTEMVRPFLVWVGL
jgi:hypothetical protein